MPVKARVNKRDLEFAGHLKMVRKEKGFTQEQVAEKIGISLTHYSYIELAYKLPNMHMLQRIADALGVKVKELIPF